MTRRSSLIIVITCTWAAWVPAERGPWTAYAGTGSPFLLTPTIPAEVELSGRELYSLLGEANEAFRQANSMPGNPRAEKLYEKAILSFEKIIHDGSIQNAKLYYNLGNAYLLKGDLGRAILSYRRAEQLDGSDANIRKNLAFARSKRLDLITPKAKKRILTTLFVWHYRTSVKVRFVGACVCLWLVCAGLILMLWFGRSPAATGVAVIGAVLLLCLSVSVIAEAASGAGRCCGVITAEEVLAHQADWENSPPAFKEPLHAGTEFDLIEGRHGWLHIRLADNTDAWIPENDAELI